MLDLGGGVDGGVVVDSTTGELQLATHGGQQLVHECSGSRRLLPPPLRRWALALDLRPHLSSKASHLHPQA